MLNRRMNLMLAARVFALVGATLYTAHSIAAGSSMPWEAPLQSILDSIQGPVAKIVAVMIITVTGISLAWNCPEQGRQFPAYDSLPRT